LRAASPDRSASGSRSRSFLRGRSSGCGASAWRCFWEWTFRRIA
jgi:hypothetical protein